MFFIEQNVLDPPSGGRPFSESIVSMNNVSQEIEASRPRVIDLILIFPFVWQLGLAFWANEVEWQPLGLPFMMLWQMAGIVLTTVLLAVRYKIDPLNNDEAGEVEVTGQ